MRFKALVVLVMLAAAWVGAFAGSRIAWQFAPGLPSGAAAERLSSTAFPGLRVFGGGEAKIIEPFGDGEGVKYGSVSYWVKHTEATRDVAAYSAGARDRLAAAGWEIHDYEVRAPEPLVSGGAESYAGFWATRPGLVLSFADYYWTERPAYDSPGAAAFELWRQEPSWISTATWGGAAAAAVLALLLALFVRWRRDHRALGWAAVAAVVLLLPSTLRPGEEHPMDSPWWGGFYDWGRGGAILSAAIVVVILLSTLPLAAMTRPVRRHPRIAAGAALALLLAAVAPAVMRQTGAGLPSCTPAGPPADAGAGTHVQIFVANSSTPQERALVDAAIFRSRAGSLGELVWQPGSAKYRQTYCGGGPVAEEAVAALPYFFDLDLANSANYPALLEEVDGLAGVVAVRRVAT